MTDYPPRSFIAQMSPLEIILSTASTFTARSTTRGTAPKPIDI
jgi:hypothetical protein